MDGVAEFVTTIRHSRESGLKIRHSRESGNPSAADPLPAVIASRDR